MIMGSSRKIQYLESDFNIFYDDVLLNDVKYEKLFGITIDNCLSWCQQINNIFFKDFIKAWIDVSFTNILTY